MLDIEQLTTNPQTSTTNERNVIQNLSLRANENEILVILGASGSGKTTLLRAIAGLIPLLSGRIQLNGTDISNLAPSARDLSLVFQSQNFYDHWSVLKHLQHDARHLPSDEKSARIESVLERVGLNLQSARFPQQLSGGQQQRLALARAMTAEKSVVLLDEPLVHLDEKSKQSLLQIILDLRSERRVILYVTHDQNDAMRLADRIAVLDEGRIVQCESPRTLYHSPNSLVVADSLGPFSVQRFGLERGNDKNWILSIDGTTVASVSSASLPAFPALNQVVLAMRPEWIQLYRAEEIRPASSDVGFCFEGIVTDIRFLGVATEITVLLVGSKALRIHVCMQSDEFSRSQIKVGEEVECFLPLQKAMYFDCETRTRLPLPNGA